MKTITILIFAAAMGLGLLVGVIADKAIGQFNYDRLNSKEQYHG